jgi:hypothetical protein
MFDIQAASYVQISREEIEEWLDSLGIRGWYLKPGRAGIYVLPLSAHVGIVVSSTVGTKDDAKGKGQASMKLRLESLHTGQVLNKKAMGQSHFKRTLNWRSTWKEGVERVRQAYVSSQGFYDSIAQVEDREAYMQEWTSKIESISGWIQNDFLRSLHDRVEKGGVLTDKQKDAIAKNLQTSVSRPSDPKPQEDVLPPTSVPNSHDDHLKYIGEWVTKIESYPGWEEHKILIDMHHWLSSGKVLSQRQQDLILKIVSEGSKPKPVRSEHPLLESMREVWKRAKMKNDTWTMDFVKSLAEQVGSGRTLSLRQMNILKDKYTALGVPFPDMGN